MFRLFVGTRTAREFESAPPDLRAKLARAIEALGADPRPLDCRKLTGRLAGAWRIRVGPWRVVYKVHDSERSVIALKIGPRKSIYR